MPFTFAHPAIVLPLAKNNKLFSSMGLVVGSLSPDFEYFLRMRVLGHYGHTLLDILWFNIPISLLLIWLMNTIICKPFIANLPACLQKRFYSYSIPNNPIKIIDWIILVASIFIGAISHIVWDSFTHQTGYFVLNFIELQQTIIVFGMSIAIFKLLQHSSTFIGLLIIAVLIWRLPINAIKPKQVSLSYWLAIFIITIIIVVIRFLLEPSALYLAHIVATCIMALFIAITVVSLLQRRTIICYEDS